MALRAVLFDSGDTLIRPIGDRWNPRYDFEDVVLRHTPDLSTDLFPSAFEAGQRFLEDRGSTASRDDYHRAVLDELGIGNASAALLAELDRTLPGPVVEPFPEARAVLTQLQDRGIRMAVVSDSWPTLEALFEQIGLRAYFDAFVISANLGVSKPHPRMYRTASDALGCTPEECLFVDDDPTFVAAAIRLGYEGAAIARDRPPPTDVPSMTTLDAVLDRFPNGDERAQ